jgi:hypothetical protein
MSPKNEDILVISSDQSLLSYSTGKWKISANDCKSLTSYVKGNLNQHLTGIEAVFEFTFMGVNSVMYVRKIL